MTLIYFGNIYLIYLTMYDITYTNHGKVLFNLFFFITRVQKPNLTE